MDQEERFLSTLTQTLKVSRDDDGALFLASEGEG